MLSESTWFKVHDRTVALDKMAVLDKINVRRLLSVFRQDLDQYLNIAIADDGSTPLDQFMPLVNKFSVDYLNQWLKRSVLSSYTLTAITNGYEIRFQWTPEFHTCMQVEWIQDQP